jgi:Arc/MetJ-type ribon-helix-helix transcriptional regulator
MTIHLPAELERLILQDVERGPYRAVDEFLEQAVRLLHEQEDWLASHRATIAQLVEAGGEGPARGELHEATECRPLWRRESAPGSRKSLRNERVRLRKRK